MASSTVFMKKKKEEAAADIVQEAKKETTEAVLEVDDGACWKKKTAAADGGFLANVKDHLDEFVNTSMGQHKICLKRTMSDFRDYIRHKKEQAFGSAKDGENNDVGAKEVAA